MFDHIVIVPALSEFTPVEDEAIVIDDKDLGPGVFQGASAVEFIKHCLAPWQPAVLRVCGGFVTIPSCPSIFTTNAQSFKDFIRFKNGCVMPESDFEACCRRAVWICVKNKLYNACQVAQEEVSTNAALQEHRTRMRMLRDKGNWH